MASTHLQIGGLLVAHPMNVATNVLLAVQCATYGLLLRRRRETGTHEWGAFLLLMSVATGVGAVKHGFPHALDARTYDVVLAISNVTGGLAVYFAQLATIRRSARGPSGMHRSAAYTQALAFLVVNVALGPELLLLIANTAVGLTPVIVVESRARTRRPGSGSIAAGLIVATLAALVYLADVSLGPWFDQVDLAHAVMAVSFHAIVRGAAPKDAPHLTEGSASWAS